MHSHARTTYTQIWEALQQPGGPVAHALGEVMPHVRHLHELYQLLVQQRKKRGAIDFDTVETKIVCNELGRIEQIVGVVRNDAHKLIEECMLAANTCAAALMSSSRPETRRVGKQCGLPCSSRWQPDLSKKKIQKQ